MNVHQSNLMRGMMLIGGELVPSEGGEWLESVNPANEETLGHVPQGTAADVNRAVAAAEGLRPPVTSDTRTFTDSVIAHLPAVRTDTEHFQEARQ